MESHYDAATKWLTKEGSPVERWSPTIYPQGSQSIGTTNKPLRQNEFDLDSVCQFSIFQDCHPGEIYRLIWDRLAANKR